ncbi:putative leucine-rich repeat domain superfamily [Helianthus annuus]|nr:putative leucine-rich repeat domain superfamily [Helianthus annuus]
MTKIPLPINKFKSSLHLHHHHQSSLSLSLSLSLPISLSLSEDNTITVQHQPPQPPHSLPQSHSLSCNPPSSSPISLSLLSGWRFCLRPITPESTVVVQGETLEVLNLDGCKKINDKSLVAIAESCLFLKDLDVSKSCVTDSGVACLSSSGRMNLQVLSLSGCSRVSNESLGSFEKLGKTLVGLNLQGCNSISSSVIESLVVNLWRCDILS